MNILTVLSGKKTYIVALIAAATAAAQALGYAVPDWLYAVEGALGLGALRVAVNKNAVTWLGLLKAALLAVGAFAAWLKDRQLIEAGRAEIVAQNLKAALDEIAKAHLARDAVRNALERDPDRLRDDDGFRRPD